MRTIRALIGMPVIVNNRRVGRVIQAQLSDDLTRLDGLWVDASFRGARFIPAESLSILGQVAVMSDDSGLRGRRKKTSLFRRAIGTDGSRLGAVTGAEIDEISFRTEALEISLGLWDDLLYGRTRIRAFTLNSPDGDVVIDIAETEKEVPLREKRNDQRSGYGSGDRRFGRDDVRHHELAERPSDEHEDEANRPLDCQQDG